LKTEGFGGFEKMKKSEKGFEKMKKSEKTFNKYEYDRKYHRENYYRMNIVLTRKEMREELKAAAVKEGKSLNKFILDALKEKLDRMA